MRESRKIERVGLEGQNIKFEKRVGKRESQTRGSDESVGWESWTRELNEEADESRMREADERVL